MYRKQLNMDGLDKFAGFYERLPDVKLPGIQATADKISGAVAVSGNCRRHKQPML